MQHKIGLDYSKILEQRKNKKNLPLIGVLANIKFDIQKLQEQTLELLKYRSQAMNDPNASSLDPASSEHNYHLKTNSGESFIKNYDSFYQKYSIVGLQTLSDDAKKAAASLNFSVSDLTPSERLRGMRNTSYAKYHPLYDERNYTKPTPYLNGAFKDALHSFKAEPCRSALVCLDSQKHISPHYDIGPEYITRIMIPIFTNLDAVVGVRTNDGYNEYHLPADGRAYFINSGFEHYALNAGADPRYQIRVCLNGQEDLDSLEPLEPIRQISFADFPNHPCGTNHIISENILLDTLKEFNLEKSGGATLT